MKRWKTNYIGPFQVRTAGGRLIGAPISKEYAEAVAEKGRGREVWQWDERDGKYHHRRTY